MSLFDHGLLDVADPDQPEAAAPGPASPPLSVATFVAEVLPTWTDRSQTWRRDAASAFRCLARACDRPLSAIMMTYGDIAASVKAAQSRCHPLGGNQRSPIKCSVAQQTGLSIESA